MRKIACWAVSLLLWMPLVIQSAPMAPALANRYHALLEELRCLVCQNESLAESNAALATDLRAVIRGMMKRGASNEQIINFLVLRYGDFILYRPPFKPITYLLWLAPFVLAATGLTVLLYKIGQRASREERPLSAQEQNQLRKLLCDGNKD
ncbi:MAG: cytochrome c-type biogenesis protein CcmH [Pseudomonadota bacterium]|nr:cytochrome c-type biogenesis protein CcmH [Pseudomonadota bacterium]